MIVKQFIITASEGLHARPASSLVGAVSSFNSDVNLTFNEKTVNLKSILGVMSLGIPANSVISISANGLDEGAVFEKIEDVIATIGLGKLC